MPFLTSEKDADLNIAESDHQRNFCKKTQIKSSFGSEEDSGRSYRHTHTHTHRHGHTIHFIGIYYLSLCGYVNQKPLESGISIHFVYGDTLGEILISSIGWRWLGVIKICAFGAVHRQNLKKPEFLKSRKVNVYVWVMIIQPIISRWDGIQGVDGMLQRIRYHCQEQNSLHNSMIHDDSQK